MEASQSSPIQPPSRSPKLKPVTRAVHYLIALIPIFLILIARLMLWRILERRSPFLMFSLAVMFAAWYGGFGAGVVATVLSAMFSGFFLIEPLRSFQIAEPPLQIELGLFVLTGIGITLLAQRLRSARRSAENAAQRNKEILESIQDGFVTVDREFRFTYTNTAAEKLLERSASDLIGKRVHEICPAVEHECRRALNEQKPIRFECFNPDVNKFFDISGSPSGHGGLSLSFRDITERKRNEQELSRLASIVNSSEDAIISADLTGVIVTWNAAAERIYGYTADEVRGSKVDILVPADRPDEEARILSLLRQGLNLQHYETVRVRKDGKSIFVSLTISPILGSAGAVVGASGIVRDISERKLLEDQLRQTAKLESLGVLAGGIAHDFNNLLVGILGNASLAMDILPAVSPVRPMLDDVVRASERAANLTRQLLAYSGKGKFIVQTVNLSELAREMASLVRTSIPKSVELKFNFADALPAVCADVAQLQQLIMNLVINGAEAIGDKPGVVTITTGIERIEETSQVELSADEIKPGEYVFLRVEDNGSGMDRDTMAKIFDPFFTTKFTGRGLGLSAALGIVRGHKGHIRVESSPGQGSTFCILLPAVLEKAESKAVQPAGERVSGSGVILVVDDEEMVRRTAALALEHCGYTVLEASNGQEAVELFKKASDQIGLVVLDLSMPMMTGEECLKQLKDIRPDVRVLISSGFPESDAVRRFQPNGISGFLQKPYTVMRLAELARTALSSVENTL